MSPDVFVINSGSTKAALRRRSSGRVSEVRKRDRNTADDNSQRNTKMLSRTSNTVQKQNCESTHSRQNGDVRQLEWQFFVQSKEHAKKEVASHS
ncbi:hypothetical protein [Ekhidna sp.]